LFAFDPYLATERKPEIQTEGIRKRKIKNEPDGT
jgi:hypothetical protein